MNADFQCNCKVNAARGVAIREFCANESKSGASWRLIRAYRSRNAHLLVYTNEVELTKWRSLIMYLLANPLKYIVKVEITL